MEEGPARVGLWNKIGELYRDRLNKADRAQKAYEKALSFDGRQPGGRAGADPALREDQGHQAPRRGAAHRARSRPRPGASARRACSGWPTCSTWAPATSAARCAIALQALAESPTDGWAITDLPPPGRQEGRLAGAGGGLRGGGAARWARPTRMRSLALLGTLAAAYERSWRIPRRRSRATRRSWSSRPRTPRRSAALERLFIATGRFADLLAIYDKKLELAKSKAEELRSASSWPVSTRTRSSSPTRRSSSISAILEQDPTQLPALAALDRLYQQLGRWKELAATIDTGDRPLHRHGRRRRAEVPARRDPGAVSGGRRGRGRVVPRGAGAGAVPRRRAHRAAGVPVQQRRRLQRAAVEVLEPIYESNNDIAAPRGGPADQARPREEDRKARRPAVEDWQAGRPAGEHRPGLGGLHPRGRREPRLGAGARGAGEPGQHPRQLAAAGRALREGALGEGQGEAAVGAGARAAAGRRGRVRREAGALRPRGRVLPARAEHPARGRLGAGGAGAALHAHRALERSRRHAAEEGAAGHRRRRARGDPDPHRDRLGRDAGQRRAGDRRLERRPSGQPGQRAGAARARPAVPDARASSASSPTTCSASWLWSPTIPPETVLLLGRLGRAARAAPRTARRRRRHLREDPRARAGARETIAALERILPSPEHEVDVAKLLEPIYKIRGDWPRLIGVYEVEARHAVDPERRSRSTSRSPRATRSGWTIRGTRTRRSPARWPRIR